jgi:hypothetical protein
MFATAWDESSLFLRVCDRYYFVASVVKANGSLEFAAGMASGGLRSQRDNGFKRSPKKMPSISRDGIVDRCFHPECRQATGGPHFHQGGIRHGTYCNGNEQPWEAGKQMCVMQCLRLIQTNFISLSYQNSFGFGVANAGKVHECPCREMSHCHPRFG